MKLAILFMALLCLASVARGEVKVIDKDFDTANFNNGDGWAVSGANKNERATTCGNQRIFGGFGIFGKEAVISKLWNNLPPHYKVTIKFNFQKIDSWDNEKFLVYVNGDLIHESVYKHGPDVEPNVCGAGVTQWTDQVVPLSLTFAHNQADLFIVMTTTLNQAADDESWGINKFELSVETCPEGCTFCRNDNAAECKNLALAAQSWTGNTVAQEGWTVQKAKKVQATKCGAASIFGGFDSFGAGAHISRTFELRPHTKLILKLQFWRLDSWDGEKAYMVVDGKKVWEMTDNHANRGGMYNSVCGGGENLWTDNIFDVDVTIDHASPSMTVEIYSTLNQDAADESWGVRDFQAFTINEGINEAPIARDLDSNNFKTAEGWTAFPPIKGNIVSDCGGVRLLGGYKLFGKSASLVKHFANLPPHYALRIRMKVMKIDSWDNHEFFVFADGASIFKQQYHYTTGTQQCGVDHPYYKEQMTAFDQVFDHTGSGLTVVMTSNLDEGAANESWGIRDFELLALTCSESCNVCGNKEAKDCLDWRLQEEALISNKKQEFVKGNPWVATGAANAFTECGDVDLFGGYDVFGKGATITRELKNLPDHKAVKIRFQFWRIDSWDNEYAYLQVNGKEVWKKNFPHTVGFKNSICGNVHNHWLEDMVNVDVTVPSTELNLKIVIGTNLDSAANDESWGIRDYQLFLQDGSLEDEDDRDVLAKNWDFRAFKGNNWPASDLEGWSATGAYQKELVSSCGAIRMIGGVGVFGKGSSLTKLIELEPHYKLRLKVKLLRLESWDNEEFRVFADGVQVYAKKFVHTQGKQICGHDGWKEEIEIIDVVFAHTNNNLALTFASTLDQDAKDEAWGIKNVRIETLKCPQGCLLCDEDSIKNAQCKKWTLVDKDFQSPSNEPEGWAVTGAAPIGTKCADVALFGGFSAFGPRAAIQKQFQQVPVHNNLRLRFQLWRIDSWDGEHLRVFVDDKLVWQRAFNHAQGVNICGQAVWLDEVFDVDFTFEHTASVANIKIDSTLDQGAEDESWGIRDLELYSMALTEVADPGADDPLIYYKAFQGNNFQNLDGWVAVNTFSDTPITSCAGTRLVGGFGVLGKQSSLSKQIPLPPHHKIEVRFQLYKIDSWDNEEFLFYVDGEKVYNAKLHHSQGEQVCGQGHNQWNEQVVSVAASVKHTGASVNVLLTSSLDQNADDESWGIRNFQLIVHRCPKGCQQCSEGDVKKEQCNQWSLVDEDFVSVGSDDAKNWKVTDAQPLFTNCGGARMFGGYNVFGTKTHITKSLADLPPHNRVMIKAQFWRIDSWDGERAQLMLDDKEIWGMNLQHAASGFATNICGAIWSDWVVDISVEVDHVGSSATLMFKTGLDQPKNDESWGVRDIQVFTEKLEDTKPVVQPDVKLVYSSFTDNKFTDKGEWVVTNAQQADPVTSCDGKRLLGGFHVFGNNHGSATLFKALPPHYQVRVKFTLYLLDSWDNEEFKLFVDGTEAHTRKRQHNQGAGNICGASGWKDEIFEVDVTVPHNAPNVQIFMGSNLNQHSNDESWGFRDFYLWAEPCPEGCIVCDKGTLETCSSQKLIASSWIENKQLDADGWNVAKAESKATVCSGINVFGGFGVFGQGAAISKAFTKLPPHNHLFVSFQFWKIDSWDNERFVLQVDGQDRWSQAYVYHSGANLCGQQHNQWNEQVFDVTVRIDHVNPEALITFTSTLNQGADDESWGIRNFQLFYTQVKDDVTAPKALFSSFFGQLFDDVNGWTATNVKENVPLFSACGDIRTIGGYRVFGAKAALSRSFQLPPHYRLKIAFKFLKLDSWDNHSFFVYVDGVQVSTKQLGLKNGKQLCGVTSDNRYVEELVTVELNPIHNAPTANVLITTNLNEGAGNESWGIREFSLDIEECAGKCATCSDNSQKCENWQLVASSLTEQTVDKLDISKWDVQFANGKNFVTQCLATPMLGGFGVLGQKAAAIIKFAKLPAHNVLKLKVQFWKIDSWDNEHFQIFVDNVLAFQKSYVYHAGFKNSVCGQGHNQWNEDVDNIEIDFDHTGSDITLRFTSTLNQAANDESWGIRDLQVFAQQIEGGAEVVNANKPFYSAFMTNQFEDIEGWTPVNAATSDLVTACGGSRLYGGFGVFGQKASIAKIIELPPHKDVLVKFKLFKIDSWDNEQFFLYLDGQQVFDEKYQWSQGTDLCGNSQAKQWKEQVSTVEVKVPHTAGTLTIVMTSSLDQGAQDESWGIREFQLWVDQCPKGCTICDEQAKPTETKLSLQDKKEGANKKQQCLAWKLFAESFGNIAIKDNEGWTVREGVNAPFTCAGVSVFGGFAHFGKGAQMERTFKGLPSHNKLRVKLNFWKFDSWDNEKAYLIVDGAVRWQLNIGGSTVNFLNSLCGQNHAGWNEDIIPVDAVFDHVADSVTILVKTDLDQASKDESWGLRDVQIFVEPTTAEDQAPPANKDAAYTAFQSNVFKDLDGWTITNPHGKDQITSCADLRLVGGYGVLGKQSVLSRQFKLTPHFQVRIKFTLVKIDSWDNEQFLLYADGKQVYNKQFLHQNGKQVCGNNIDKHNEEIEQVDITVPHTADNLFVIMSSTLNQDANDESWGIRDFELYTSKCSEKCEFCVKADACLPYKLQSASWTANDKLDNDGWSSVPDKAKVTTCAGIQIFGGANEFGKGAQIEKQFTVAPHNKLIIRFQFWRLDSWDGEKMQVFVDGKEEFALAMGHEGNSLCGVQGWLDSVKDVEFDVDNTNTKPTIRISSTLNQGANDEAWGIRDFQLLTDDTVVPQLVQATQSKPADNALFSDFFGNTFDNTNGWSVIQVQYPNRKVPANVISSCGGLRLLGGFGILGRGNSVMKQFTLPPHSEVTISFRLMKIDSWDNEEFLAYADGALLVTKKYNGGKGKQLCGQMQSKTSWFEEEEMITVTFEHNAATLTLILTSSLNEWADNESWGFRDFQLSINACPKDCKVCIKSDQHATCASWNLLASSWTKSDGLAPEGWSTSTQKDPQQTQCGPVAIFGGRGQLDKSGIRLQRQFFNMPAHSKLRVQVQLWRIDAQHATRFSVFVDGVEVKGVNIVPAKNIRVQLCGTGQLEQVQDIDFEVPHNRQTLTIELTSTLAAPDSWAVRDFYLYVDQVAPSKVEASKPVYEVANTPQIDQAALADWSFPGQKAGSPLVNQCGDSQIVGGFGAFGAGAWAVINKTLKPHFSVTIRLKVYKIDSWDNEHFFVYVDGVKVYQKHFTFVAGGKQLCGQSHAGWTEDIEEVEVTLPHKRNDITIMMTSTLNQDANDESWGFRDFSITVKPCPEGCAICDNANPNKCGLWKPLEYNFNTVNFDADGWAVDKADAGFTECIKGVRLFGGLGKFGAFASIKKTFNKLPTHGKLRIQLQFWKIDSWDNHRASIFVDGREVWGRNFGLKISSYLSMCGIHNNHHHWDEEIANIDVQFDHQQSTAEIEIRTTLDQGAGDESWGVRSLYVFTGQCAEGCIDCNGVRKQDCVVPKESTQVYSAFVGDFDPSDTNKWTVLNPFDKNLITKCGDTKMFGGFNVFGKGSMLNSVIALPAHYLVRVQFNLHKIDTWDNEAFYLYMDGTEMYQHRFAATEGQNKCGHGGQSGEVVVPIDVTLKHSNPSVVITIQTNLNEHANNESWGINNFILSVGKCPAGCAVCSNPNAKACDLWEAVPPIWNTNDAVPALGWSIKNAASNQVSTDCGGVRLLGGASVFGKDTLISRSYDDLPKHDMLRIQMQFWKIDQWEFEMAQLKVDGKTVWYTYFVVQWEGFHQPICGLDIFYQNERAVNVDISIPHVGSEAVIEITTNLNEAASNEAWGIREFNLFKASCEDNCEYCNTEQNCMKCRGDWLLQKGNCVRPAQSLVVASDFTEKKFNTQQGWSFIGAKGTNKVSSCADVSLAGGFDIFGKGARAEKKFTLSGHETLRLRVQIWTIDSWDNEEIVIMVDNNVVYRKDFGQASKGLPQCGNGHLFWHEVIENVDVTIPHTADNAIVTITSTLDQDAADESWGFRDFYLATDSTDDCAYFYSECNYQGEFVRYCKESRNTLKNNFLNKIRSFKIPNAGKVTLFETSDFDTHVVEVTGSNDCVAEDTNLALAQGSRLLFEEPSRNLRRSRV